jgi:hypothetical protein
MLSNWKTATCVAAFLFSLTLLGSGWGGTVLAQQHSPQVWSGWVGKVTDSNCGAMHKIADAKECTLQCVRAGGKYALAIGEPAAKIYTLDGNSSSFEPLAGTMAKVQGDLNGTTVKVTTAEAH